MILKAAEDDVYRLMDVKERCLTGAGLCVAGVILFAYLLSFRICWEWLYFFTVAVVGIFMLLYAVKNINSRIMEIDNCYIELEVDSIVVRQAEKNGHYECCRIFYHEMEQIVEGSKQGYAEFYIVLKNIDDRDRESFILLDEEERKTQAFCVKSFGYDKKRFQELYHKFQDHVPSDIIRIDTKEQEAWFMPKKRIEVFLIVALGVFYLVSKIIESLF